MLTKKLTKYIWYEGKRYKIIDFISPNKFDDFILCSRLRDKHIHNDGKTIPVDMILLDCHNDEFYPDTKKVRDIIYDNDGTAKYLREKDSINRQYLTSQWLKIVR